MANANEPTPEVSIDLAGDHVAIRNATSGEYGGLLSNKTTASLTLRQLSGQYGASFQGFLLQMKRKAGSAQGVELYVVIYGARAQADTIGNVLDSAQMFLQHPPAQFLSVPYRNPHYLSNPTLETETGTTTGMTTTIGTSQVLEDNSPLKRRIQEVIDSAQGPLTYSATAPSHRLRTSLKP